MFKQHMTDYWHTHPYCDTIHLMKPHLMCQPRAAAAAAATTTTGEGGRLRVLVVDIGPLRRNWTQEGSHS
eukprot:COSAG05_NODE_14560_length_393_cov_1.224490_1_plen_69_part_10